ncbi:hypothetical protein Bbelb_202680 [Branchiostoma belcheri]|nr:hypothetical protein Bbelb_202680 [Branchiostoma belcheri]
MGRNPRAPASPGAAFRGSMCYNRDTMSGLSCPSYSQASVVLHWLLFAQWSIITQRFTILAPGHTQDVSGTRKFPYPATNTCGSRDDSVPVPAGFFSLSLVPIDNNRITGGINAVVVAIFLRQGQGGWTGAILSGAERAGKNSQTQAYMDTRRAFTSVGRKRVGTGALGARLGGTAERERRPLSAVRYIYRSGRRLSLRAGSRDAGRRYITCTQTCQLGLWRGRVHYQCFKGASKTDPSLVLKGYLFFIDALCTDSLLWVESNGASVKNLIYIFVIPSHCIEAVVEEIDPLGYGMGQFLPTSYRTPLTPETDNVVQSLPVSTHMPRARRPLNDEWSAPCTDESSLRWQRAYSLIDWRSDRQNADVLTRFALLRCSLLIRFLPSPLRLMYEQRCLQCSGIEISLGSRDPEKQLEIFWQRKAVASNQHLRELSPRACQQENVLLAGKTRCRHICLVIRRYYCATCSEQGEHRLLASVAL